MAAAVWFSMAGSVTGRAGSVALALALVALVTYNSGTRDRRRATPRATSCSNEIFVKWNSFSRIAVGTAAGAPAT